MKEARHASFWEAHRPGLHPPARHLPDRVDVLIVGAGFAGLWLGWFLRRRDPRLRVLILERDRLGYGASTRNAGFLSCGSLSEWVADAELLGQEAALRLFEARREGIRIILEECGHRLAVETCGSADFEESSDEIEQMASLMPAFHQRTLTLGGRQRLAWVNPHDCGIDPVELLRTLHFELSTRSIEFGYGAEVSELADGVCEVRLNRGSATVSYDHAYICTNGFVSELHPATRVRPCRGQMIATAPCEIHASRVLGFLNGGYDYFRVVEGRLLVGGGRQHHGASEETASLESTDDIRTYLVRLAGQILGHDDVRIEHQWSGIMGMPDGRHGIPDCFEDRVKVDDRTEVIAGFGGWGVSLSPLVARMRAEDW